MSSGAKSPFKKCLQNVCHHHCKKYNKVRAFKMLNTYLFICFDRCSALRENEQLSPNHQTAYTGGKQVVGRVAAFQLTLRLIALTEEKKDLCLGPCLLEEQSKQFCIQYLKVVDWKVPHLDTISEPC